MCVFLREGFCRLGFKYVTHSHILTAKSVLRPYFDRSFFAPVDGILMPLNANIKYARWKPQDFFCHQTSNI